MLSDEEQDREMSIHIQLTCNHNYAAKPDVNPVGDSYSQLSSHQLRPLAHRAELSYSAGKMWECLQLGIPDRPL
jgi:hypothetical protein